MLAVARTVAALPSAYLLIPKIEPWGLALVALGGVWLCLWRQRWRWLGLPAILAGLASSGAAPIPDILVTADGRLAAVRTPQGDLALSSTRRGRYAARRWLDRYGQRDAALWTETTKNGAPKTGPPPARCDAAGCLFRRSGYRVAFVATPDAFVEDCFRADLLITPLARPPNCPTPRLIIDKAALNRGGSHAIWLPATPGAGPIRVLTDRRLRGARPWVPAVARRAGRLPYGRKRLRTARRAQKWRIRPIRRP
jgi:competence protein ComEC